MTYVKINVFILIYYSSQLLKMLKHRNAKKFGIYSSLNSRKLSLCSILESLQKLSQELFEFDTEFQFCPYGPYVTINIFFRESISLFSCKSFVSIYICCITPHSVYFITFM